MATTETTTQTAGYACRPEVRALARMHYDRERLAGDWDDCERAVLDGSHPARARILDRLLTEHLRKAERDIADVRAVMEALNVGPMENQTTAPLDEPAFILKFADRDMEDIYFAGYGAEEAAWKCFDLRRTSWTVMLFKEVARG